MDNSEFDLHQDYHAAIECVVQCEFIIKSLQEQLTSKEECISSLEEKLVAMSLELALAKASEDEHRLLKRKLNRASDNDQDQGCVNNVNNIMMSEGSSAQQQQEKYHKATSEFYVPRRKNSKDMKEEQEGEGASSSQKITNTPHHPQESSPTPADRRRGFRMSSLRSWENENNNDNTTNSGNTSRNTSFSSLNPNGGGAAMCATRQQASSDSSRLARYNRQTSWNSLLNDASRLSSLGNFLLGSSNNGDVIRRGEGEQTVVDLDDAVMRNLPEGGVRHRVQHQQDCCSIDGVVFPVSSAEVLAGCLSEDEDWSPQHVNDEWPKFK